MLVELRKKERVEREGEGRGTFDRVSGSTSHIALLAILPYSQSVRTASHLVRSSGLLNRFKLPKFLCAKSVNLSSEVWRFRVL